MAATTKRYTNWSLKPHAHGCTACKGRYEDTCSEPNDNRVCNPCQGFEPWQLLINNRLPKDCCRAHSRLCSKDERNHYRLSEACAWWRCLVCSRTFPYLQPKDPS